MTITDSLRQCLATHFPQRHAASDLPDALLIWPVPYGGYQLQEHGLHSLLQTTALVDLDTKEPLTKPFAEKLKDARVLYGRVKKA